MEAKAHGYEIHLHLCIHILGFGPYTQQVMKDTNGKLKHSKSGIHYVIMINMAYTVFDVISALGAYKIIFIAFLVIKRCLQNREI